MPLEDSKTRRRVEHEIAKHDLDFSLATVAVINQVAYFTGRVRSMRGTGRGIETKKVMEKVADAVRALPGVKDVVLDCQFD
jgi:osmotically-inducible protein OsmY